MASKFSQSEISYKDTRKAGGISVHGIELQADVDGFIDAPASLAGHLEPHGFIPMDRDAEKKQGTLSLKK